MNRSGSKCECVCVRAHMQEGGMTGICSVWKKQHSGSWCRQLGYVNTEGVGLGDKVVSLTLELNVNTCEILEGGEAAQMYGSWSQW